jgi:hypothetical protein
VNVDDLESDGPFVEDAERFMTLSYDELVPDSMIEAWTRLSDALTAFAQLYVESLISAWRGALDVIQEVKESQNDK